MKKIFIPALASLLFLAASCNSNGYKVQGNIESAQDGDTVFFARLADEGWMPADTAIVSNGKFQIEGTADSSEIFSYFFENESSYYQDILFIEPGTITLSLKGSNEDVEIKGSKSNEIYRSTMDTLTAYRKEMNSIYEKAMSKEEGQRPSEEIMAEIKGLEDKAISFLKKQTSDNIDNLAGYFLFASNVSIFTPEEVQGIVEKQVTLLGLFREHNEEYTQRIGVNRSVSTVYQYKHTYRFVADFLEKKYKVSDIPFKALDEHFMEAFELYLRIDLNFQPGTSIGHVQRLKHIAQIAVNRCIVPFSPFKDFSPVKPKQKQMYLTREELDRLMNTTFDTPNRNFTRDMFLFSVFTGICYCDMRNLTEKNVTRDSDGNLWIETRRQKTGTPENVRLLDIAVRIIEKYRGMDSGGKLFPMLTKESMNIHLKKMAVQCGITRNLSFHMARHINFSYSLKTRNLQRFSA